MTSKNLYFKLMREDWKNRLWAPALIALGCFFLYPVFLGGVVLIQHAVDASGAGDAAHYLVRGFLHILHQMAGDIDAGDLVPVALREGDHLVGGVFLLHGEGGVDKNSVGVGNGVQHLLEGSQ